MSRLDVVPTLLGLLGIDPEDRCDGFDLRYPPDDRVVASAWAGEVAVRNADRKLIFVGGEPQLLYQASRDAVKRWNSAFDQPEVMASLVKRAAPYPELHDRIQAEKIEKQLHAIGFIP